MTPEEIIAERAKTHGLYEKMAGLQSEFMKLARSYNTSGLSCAQHFSMNMIFVKLARIIVGDPNFRDHWDDIAGYAKLAADRCSAPAPAEKKVPRFDEQNEPPPPDKPACFCKPGKCAVEEGASLKYVYCRKAENADKVACPCGATCYLRQTGLALPAGTYCRGITSSRAAE